MTINKARRPVHNYLSSEYMKWVENSKNFGKLKHVEKTITGRM